MATVFGYYYWLQQSQEISINLRKLKWTSVINQPNRDPFYYEVKTNKFKETKTVRGTQLVLEQEPAKCSSKRNGVAVKHIAYLKVHKTGSTTLQNIFLRFGSVRNLTFVIPENPNAGFPNIISLIDSINKKNILPSPPGKSFDILCCHVVYSKRAFSFVMPKDTSYIGIVRDPWRQFISTVEYFRPVEVLGRNFTRPITSFLHQTEKYVIRNPKYSLVNNRMAFEFNFPSSLFKNRNDEILKRYLNKLDKEFKLVVITEYFDESLILLRRYLNWSLKDILYVRFNVRRKQKYRYQNHDRRLYRKFATLDYALYDYFVKRLQERIKQESGFHEELRRFKYVRSKTEMFCITHRRRKEDILEIVDKCGGRFTVTKSDCDLMFMPEIRFIQLLRQRQYPAS